MAYYGNAPADVALVVGQDVITTTEIQDSTIATADIANDAITALKIDDDGTGFQMGSLGLGTAVSGSEKLTVGGTASFTDDVSLSTAGKRLYIPRASDGALTGSLYSSTGNTITLSGAGSSSGQINFIPSASNSSAVAMTMKSNGEIQFGDSNNTASLYHYGEGKFAINDSAGSASTPTYAFNSDTDTGMYRGGANDLRFATNGTQRMQIESDGTVVMAGALQPAGNLSVGGYAKTSNYFETAGGSGGQQAFSSSVTSSYRGGGLIRFFTDNNVSIFKLGNESAPYGGYFGTFAGYSPSGAELMILGIDGVNIGKNRNSEAIGLRCSTAGTLQSGAGSINATNADNWQSVVKSTTGGTIDSGGGMGYFALGDNYTTNSGILMVRNDGNRGSRRHASGSSLFKASFNDATAFEIRKDGEIHGGFGCPVGFTGNWEVIDIISCGSAVGSLSSNNCFNDQTYSHFKIIIPHYRPTDNATDILLSFLYNTGSGLSEQVGDYYGHKQSMAHTNSGYLGGTYTNANRMTIFSGASNSTHAPTHGEITVFNVNTADTRNFDTGKFTAHDYAGDGDTGSTYRPIGYFDMVGYNDTSDYYSRDTGMFRINTSRHASYWKGFRIQQSTGNISANTKIIVLGMKL